MTEAEALAKRPVPIHRAMMFLLDWYIETNPEEKDRARAIGAELDAYFHVVPNPGQE